MAVQKQEIKTVAAYLEQVPEPYRLALQRLREVILAHLPKGYAEVISYGMIGYVVPHAIYPDGYHCTPALPLPFMNIASQKSGLVLYHMGLYADAGLIHWFVTEYERVTGKKPDMGKSCIRFKKPDQLPFELIGVLAGKMPVDDWIRLYEKNLLPKSRRSSKI
ncbi:DUF1801 domain-containing protein [Niabella beijingensis]|uniref:DUF1801 domain-containing protein n=1 Tax=Niabella beijingensis TaxID=2872700 RepID=UPI001CC081C9|nr:DUF1801 domain-containing protein [Niabella beijingensis]MBZ4188190.1 DUF1801 domain-containing protein [Niabella beijingensis]